MTVKIKILLLILLPNYTAATFFTALNGLLNPPAPPPPPSNPPMSPPYPTYKAFIDPNPPRPPMKPRYVPKPYPDYVVSFASPGGGVGLGGIRLNFNGNANYQSPPQYAYNNMPSYIGSNYLPNGGNNNEYNVQSYPAMYNAQVNGQEMPVGYSAINAQSLTSQIDFDLPAGSSVDLPLEFLNVQQGGGNFAVDGDGFGQIKVTTGIGVDGFGGDIREFDVPIDDVTEKVTTVREDVIVEDVEKSTEKSAVLPQQPKKEPVPVNGPSFNIDDYRLVFVPNSGIQSADGDKQFPKSIFRPDQAKTDGSFYGPDLANINSENMPNLGPFYTPIPVQENPTTIPTPIVEVVTEPIRNEDEAATVNSNSDPQSAVSSGIAESESVAEDASSVAANDASSIAADDPVRSPAAVADVPFSAASAPLGGGGFGNMFSSGLGNVPQLLSSAFGNSRTPFSSSGGQGSFNGGVPLDPAISGGAPAPIASGGDFRGVIPGSAGDFQGIMPGYQYNPYAPMFFHPGYNEMGSSFSRPVLHSGRYQPSEETKTTLLLLEPNKNINSDFGIEGAYPSNAMSPSSNYYTPNRKPYWEQGGHNYEHSGAPETDDNLPQDHYNTEEYRRPSAPGSLNHHYHPDSSSSSYADGGEYQPIPSDVHGKGNSGVEDKPNYHERPGNVDGNYESDGRGVKGETVNDYKETGPVYIGESYRQPGQEQFGKDYKETGPVYIGGSYGQTGQEQIGKDYKETGPVYIGESYRQTGQEQIGKGFKEAGSEYIGENYKQGGLEQFDNDYKQSGPEYIGENFKQTGSEHVGESYPLPEQYEPLVNSEDYRNVISKDDFGVYRQVESEISITPRNPMMIQQQNVESYQGSFTNDNFNIRGETEIESPRKEYKEHEERNHEHEEFLLPEEYEKQTSFHHDKTIGKQDVEIQPGILRPSLIPNYHTIPKGGFNIQPGYSGKIEFPAVANVEFASRRPDILPSQNDRDIPSSQISGDITSSQSGSDKTITDINNQESFANYPEYHGTIYIPSNGVMEEFEIEPEVPTGTGLSNPPLEYVDGSQVIRVTSPQPRYSLEPIEPVHYELPSTISSVYPKRPAYGEELDDDAVDDKQETYVEQPYHLPDDSAYAHHESSVYEKSDVSGSRNYILRTPAPRVKYEDQNEYNPGVVSNEHFEEKGVASESKDYVLRTPAPRPESNAQYQYKPVMLVGPFYQERPDEVKSSDYTSSADKNYVPKNPEVYPESNYNLLVTSPAPDYNQPEYPAYQPDYKPAEDKIQPVYPSYHPDYKPAEDKVHSDYPASNPGYNSEGENYQSGYSPYQPDYKSPEDKIQPGYPSYQPEYKPAEDKLHIDYNNLQVNLTAPNDPHHNSRQFPYYEPPKQENVNSRPAYPADEDDDVQEAYPGDIAGLSNSYVESASQISIHDNSAITPHTVLGEAYNAYKPIALIGPFGGSAARQSVPVDPQSVEKSSDVSSSDYYYNNPAPAKQRSLEVKEEDSSDDFRGGISTRIPPFPKRTPIRRKKLPSNQNVLMVSSPPPTEDHELYKPVMLLGPFQDNDTTTDNPQRIAEVDNSEIEHSVPPEIEDHQTKESNDHGEIAPVGDTYVPVIVAGPFVESSAEIDPSFPDPDFAPVETESLGEKYSPVIVAGPFLEDHQENFDTTVPNNPTEETLDMSTLERQQNDEVDDADELMLPPSSAGSSPLPTVATQDAEYKPVLLVGPIQPKGDIDDQENVIPNSSPIPDVVLSTTSTPEILGRWRTQSPRRKYSSRLRVSGFFPTTYHPPTSSNDDVSVVSAAADKIDVAGDDVKFGMRIHPKLTFVRKN